MRRSILLVVYFYPPSEEVGTLRPLALVRHLRARGHRVTVLTTRAYGTEPQDRDGVERTYDLQLLPARVRGHAAAPEGFGIARDKPHPLSRFLVPDAHLAAWAPFALSRAIRLARRERFDCVLTTSPPESAHLIGRTLALRGMPWVADLQDGWSFERPADELRWKPEWQRRYNQRLERRILPRAEGVIAVSAPLASDLRARIGIDVDVVTMGWEPDDFADLDLEAARRHLDPDRISIVYTGRIKAAGRDAEPLVAAIAELAAEDPKAAGKIELVIAGSFTDQESEMLKRDVSPARIALLGRLPRSDVLALQQAADVGLLLTPPNVRYQIPAKTFEYIGAGAPILALTEPYSAAADLVRQSGAGMVVPLGDVGGIKEALKAIAEQGPPPPCEDPERYTNEALIGGIEDAVERAIAQAGRR
ncbi:MAG TPA: glycosyltransferase family 4 protein [Solirubrobacterales bacterium]|jgi:glycosyltransferase involved in cell wall biosynthesis|nr:glycosyltransferase family 4 protein [Solirubrobacterales bacterium]